MKDRTMQPQQDLERWIAREFGGRGRALRLQDDPPLEGEPWMSMEEAKDIVRRAVAEFSSIG
jgi:hypothetical protein